MYFWGDLVYVRLGCHEVDHPYYWYLFLFCFCFLFLFFWFSCGRYVETDSNALLQKRFQRGS